MKTGETKVIDQREQGSMGGGCWQEFLVLEKLNATEFLLDIRRWDYLGEVGDLEEDKDGEPIMPEEIDGKLVAYVDDGFAYGGDLVKSGGEEGEVKLTRPDQGEIIRWLEGVMWHDEDVIKALAEERIP